MNASYHSQVRLSARGALRVRLGFERYSFEPWTIPMATNGIVHDTIPAEWYNLGTKTVPFEGIGIVGYTILKRGTQGEYRYVGQGEARYRAFLPLPLPPNPPLRIDAKLLELLGDADRSLGRLDIISDLIPNPKMYLRQMVFKEALLSSQIEGTQSTFSDVLMFETSLGRPPNDDVKEVSNYIEAQTEGIRRIKEGDPITLRLLNDLHAILLRSGRGNNRQPGEVRSSQNWIGGTMPSDAVYTPPPHTEIGPMINELEKFIHDVPDRTPPLIKAALAHLQFESIHPYLDGNGRLGRMLISLILLRERAFSSPVLYLSLYFKKNRDIYYSHLQSVRETGDWESWLVFFLRGIVETAEHTVDAIKRIRSLFVADQERIRQDHSKSSATLRLFELLQRQPLVTPVIAQKEMRVTKVTALKAIKRLQEASILSLAMVRGRSTFYLYDRYVEILQEGAEPLPR